MRARAITLVGIVIAMAACGAGRPKPCGWYFAADRANVSLGPVRWLSGVWRGPRATGEQIWTRLSNGSMTGLWRRAEAPAGSDRFYTLLEDGGKLTLIEISTNGTTTTYDAVEQGERAVLFSSPDHGQLRFRGDNREFELTIEGKAGATERHHFRLEI
jgi:hypothetical protein